MRLYVYSTHHRAARVHVGHPTMCGQAFVNRTTTDHVPAGMSLCPRCARLAGIVTAPVGPARVPHREVLDLLNAGHTDYAIAARLSVSVATVRRRIADLMTIVGARSRWHAGFLHGLTASGQA